MSRLHTIVYMSRSLVPPCSTGLLDIARTALLANSRHGVTGLLYYDRLFFVQHLEGPRTALLTLCANLSHDKRHADMRILRDAPLARRRFPAWDMAFCDGGAPLPLFGLALPRVALEKAENGRPAAVLAALDATVPIVRRHPPPAGAAAPP